MRIVIAVDILRANPQVQRRRSREGSPVMNNTLGRASVDIVTTDAPIPRDAPLTTATRPARDKTMPFSVRFICGSPIPLRPALDRWNGSPGKPGVWPPERILLAASITRATAFSS